MDLIEELVSDGVLEASNQWLCRRRKRYPDFSDVWSFRRDWPHEKQRVQAELRAGRYRIGLLTRVRLATGEDADMWASRDALVLKALALVLAPRLELSEHCFHLRGPAGEKRGSKAAVRLVLVRLPEYRFVLKTDVRDYYVSVDHQRLLDRLEPVVPDRRISSLVFQYLTRCAERGGLFWDHDKGIPLGSPLSPVLGGFFLRELDQRVARPGLLYVRYMDDILVLTPTRWTLRRAVRALNQGLGALGLEKQPAKTFIGRVAKGFDFLGYHLRPGGLSVAQATQEKFAARIRRLYEREHGRGQRRAVLGAYVRRWEGWATGGLGPPWRTMVGRPDVGPPELPGALRCAGATSG